jgi:hypothetical protein
MPEYSVTNQPGLYAAKPNEALQQTSDLRMLAPLAMIGSPAAELER